MNTATMTVGNPKTGSVRPRRSLEELVDRLMATLTFRVEPEMAPVDASADLVRDIHQSRRLRQEGNLDGALQTLAGAVPASASPQLTRWAFTEWKQLVRQAVRPPGPSGLQPGNGQGRRPGARGSRRDPRGGRRVGNVLEAGKACIPTQLVEPAFPSVKHGIGSGEVLPLTRVSSFPPVTPSARLTSQPLGGRDDYLCLIAREGRTDR